MKQVTYDFSMFEIMFSLMRDRDDVEDGYWEMTPRFEMAAPVVLPQMYSGQKPETLPGLLARMFAISMTRVQEPGPLTIEIRDGMVVVPRKDSDGTDRDQSGPIQSSETVGEDSRQAG